MRLVIVTLLVASTAHAEPKRIEVGLALGGHSFSETSELGTADEMTEASATSGPVLGARLAYPVLKRLAIEGEAMMIATKDDTLGDRARVFGLRAHVRFDLLTGKFRPFVVAGAGLHVLRTSSPLMDNDADRSYHWGIGARYRRWYRRDRSHRRYDLPVRQEAGAAVSTSRAAR